MAFTNIAIDHVHLVTAARYLPVSRMILLVLADGKEMSFARHVVGRAGLPHLSAITEEGPVYDPPLVMTMSHSGYLMSIVAQSDDLEHRSS
jgi:hypothetical protein